MTTEFQTHSLSLRDSIYSFSTLPGALFSSPLLTSCLHYSSVSRASSAQPGCRLTRRCLNSCSKYLTSQQQTGQTPPISFSLSTNHVSFLFPPPYCQLFLRTTINTIIIASTTNNINTNTRNCSFVWHLLVESLRIIVVLSVNQKQMLRKIVTDWITHLTQYNSVRRAAPGSIVARMSYW